jgi:phosphoglucosamine mutase
MKLFGTDGIRGVFGDYPMDESTIKKIGFSIGKVLCKKVENIYIGHDGRESFKSIYENLVQGISYNGKYNIIFLGLIPTPALSYILSSQQSSDSIGIQITASHNPYTDNGIKLFNSKGNKISSTEEMQIENSVSFNKTIQNIVTCDYSINKSSVEIYLDYLTKKINYNINTSKKINIAVDCSNGSVSYIFSYLKTKTNLSFQIFNHNPNGRNINYNCGAVHPETLSRLIIKNNSIYNHDEAEWIDFGIAFDGDGDRSILITHSGRILDGDEILYILAKDYHSDNKVVVGTIMTNHGIRTAFDMLGYSFIETDVGDKFVLRQVIENNATIGAESSGHIIHNDISDIPIGDGITTLIKIAHLIQKTNLTIDEIYPKSLKVPSLLLNILVSDKVKWLENNAEIINKVAEILNGNGRILARASGTQQLVRILLEHESSNLLVEAEKLIKG